MSFEFPDDFVFGSASASYQVEGATNADGRGKTIWDVFCSQEGKIRSGHTGEIACDHYNRYEEDVQIMKDLNMQAYRFSVAWARIIPDGDGEINQKGIDFYRKLCETLLEAGITPYVTMYHWDLPASLEERFGGWRDRRTPEAFGRYAEILVEALGDIVKNWMTLNEMPATIIAGYREGFHAPGATEGPAMINKIQHNCMLAHGYGVRAVRKHCPDGQVGTAHNARVYVPSIETDENIEATVKAFMHANGPMLEPMAKGTYPASWLEKQGENAPEFTAEDMELISSPCDFIGLNVYRGIYVEAPGQGAVGGMNVADVENVSLPVPATPTTSGAATAEDGFVELPFPTSYPKTASDWVLFVPQAIYWGIRLLNECYDFPKVYVTENGTVCNDNMVGGRILDTDRAEYYRMYLRSAARAVSEGYPLKAYFAWSIMDNFEWSDGYHSRFGIVHVDYDTLKRTPKFSAKFLAECIKARKVL